MNKYNSEDRMLAEDIMHRANDPEQAAEWVAVFRSNLEEMYADNVLFVHQQLQALRLREIDYLRRIEALQHRVAGLLNEEEFEKADTIPAPPSYTAQGGM